MRFRLVVDGEPREIEIERTSTGTRVAVDGVAYRAFPRVSQDGFAVRLGAQTYQIRFEAGRAVLDDGVHVISIGEISNEEPERTEAVAGPKNALIEVRPPMPGRVVRIAVAPGSRVKRGDVLAVLEAMKMQNEIPAPGDGTVREIRATVGELVTADQVVAVLVLD